MIVFTYSCILMKTLEKNFFENNRGHNNESVSHGQYLTISVLSVLTGKCFFDRSLNVLSVSYPVHIRFVRYISVTRTEMSVSSPLFARYLSGTYALLMRLMRSLHLPRRPSSPPRRLSPPDKHFKHFFLSVRRPLALSGDM